MNRCKTCKNWTPEDISEHGALLGGGECGKVPQVWDVAEKVDNAADDWVEIYRLKRDHAAVLAVVEDGSAYRARLVTMPGFGCVQHEAA